MTREEASYILRKFYADGYKSNNYNTLEQALQLAVMCLENFPRWISVEDELPPLNPMARLAFAQMMKWTEDFIANYHNDYHGYNSYLDEDEGPEFDGAGFTEADRDKYSLVGVDGNAYAVMGYVAQAMKECKKSHDEIDDYRKRATSGDYDNLLCVSMGMLEELNELVRTL